MFWWRQQVADDLEVAFTDAGAGNLALHVGDEPDSVRGRRAELAAAMGLDAGTLLFMNQAHSAHVARADQLVPVGSSAHGAAPDGGTMDAMVSPEGRHPMAVMVADCLPVVLAGFEPEAGTVAATAVVHAGRLGLAAGIIPAAVQELEACIGGQADSLQPPLLRAWIGPSVCGRCYEVPPEMAAEVSAAVPATATVTRQGTAGLDLAAGADAQLTGLGVQTERIAGCTMEEAGLFSHRRNRQTGRFAGLVWRGQAK